MLADDIHQKCVDTDADGMHIHKHFADVVAHAKFNVFCRRFMKKNFFTTTFLLSSNNNTAELQLHLQFFCTCHIVKNCPWVPVYFKHYHSCWQCECIRGRHSADADWKKFQDPHISDIHPHPPTALKKDRQIWTHSIL